MESRLQQGFQPSPLAIGRVTSAMLAAGEVKMAASEASDEMVINEGRDAYGWPSRIKTVF